MKNIEMIEKTINYKGYKGFIRVVDGVSSWKQFYIVVPVNDKLYGKTFEDLKLNLNLDNNRKAFFDYVNFFKKTAKNVDDYSDFSDYAWVLGIDYTNDLSKSSLDLKNIEKDLKDFIDTLKNL